MVWSMRDVAVTKVIMDIELGTGFIDRSMDSIDQLRR